MRLPLGWGGLRARLTALIGLLIVVAIGGTFAAVYHGTGTQLRQQIDRDLRTDANDFDSGTVPARPVAPVDIESAARGYLASQPFRASSRLLIFRVGSRPAVTNEPEVLQRDDPGDGEGSPANQSRQTRALLEMTPGYSSVNLPDVGSLRLYRQPVVRDGRTVADIAVGEPLAPVERAEREVARTFLLAGGATLVLGLLGGYLIAAGTSRPLRRMARVAAAVDGGDLSPRMAERGPRDEVRALADSFDTMLERLDDAFARQRAFASDASHELRTPLTVIRGQLEVLSRQDEPPAEEVRRVDRIVRVEIERMERLVEDLLVLARADEREFLRPRRFDLSDFATEMLEGVRATAERRFELSDPPPGSLSADPDRLAQAVRNLLRNAIEHTGSGGLVRLAVTVSGSRVRIAVEDDGPGIPPEQRDRVFDRFHRTDASRTRTRGGAGLGLAIARAIVEAHGGTISAGESAEGGARVVLELPGFRPAQPGRAPSEPPRLRMPT